MKTIIHLLIIICLFSACKKDEDAVTALGSLKAKSADLQINFVGPGNPENIYDTTGMYHNSILSYVHDRYPLPDRVAGQSSHLVIKAVNEQFGFNIPLQVFDTVDQTLSDEPSGYVNVIADTDLDNATKVILCDFVERLKECLRNEQSYPGIKKFITDFENSIMRLEGLPEIQRKRVLEATSMARYSTYYWMTWYPPGIQLRLKNIIKWIAVVTGDVAGIIISGHIGYAADCSIDGYDTVVWGMP